MMGSAIGFFFIAVFTIEQTACSRSLQKLPIPYKLDGGRGELASLSLGARS